MFTFTMLLDYLFLLAYYKFYSPVCFLMQMTEITRILLLLLLILLLFSILLHLPML